MLEERVSYRVKGFTNRWSIIDILDGYCLLENETFGDETFYIVCSIVANVEFLPYVNKFSGVRHTLPTIMEIVTTTYDDLETTLYDLEV